jgi:hypothetical protein
VNAKTHATNLERHNEDLQVWRKQIFKLQDQLFASEEKVYELQKKLLALREIVNNTAAAEQPPTKE